MEVSKSLAEEDKYVILATRALNFYHGFCNALDIFSSIEECDLFVVCLRQLLVTTTKGLKYISLLWFKLVSAFMDSQDLQ